MNLFNILKKIIDSVCVTWCLVVSPKCNPVTTFGAWIHWISITGNSLQNKPYENYMNIFKFQIKKSTSQ